MSDLMIMILVWTVILTGAGACGALGAWMLYIIVNRPNDKE